MTTKMTYTTRAVALLMAWIAIAWAACLASAQPPDPPQGPGDQPGWRHGQRQGAQHPQGEFGPRHDERHPRGEFGPPPGDGPRRGGPAFEELDTDSDGKVSYEEASVLPHMTEEHFAQLDTNADGYLTKEERPGPPHQRGDRPGPPPFEELDQDGDGKVSYDEASVLPHMTQEHFKQIDANGDGYLTKEERPGPRGDRPGPPPLEELDTNGDGKLSYEEMASLPRMTEEHFTRIDRNADGFITEDERPGPRGQHGPRGDRRMGPPPFEDMDADQSGGVSFDETARMPRMTEEHFKQLDLNGDGVLTPEEFVSRRQGRGQGPEGGRPRGPRPN